jgi:hypothetical protein
MAISPIDQILNSLPKIKPTSKIRKQQLINKWKLLSSLMYKIEELCHVTEDEMNPDPDEISPFITWLQKETITTDRH